MAAHDNPASRLTRVMMFCDSFTHGGTERQLVQALRHLDRSRFDLSVGCLKRRGPFLAEVESLGVPVYEFPIRSLAGFDTLREWRRLRQLLREERVDVLHAWEFYGNVFGVTAARAAGVPVVLASRRELAGDRSTVHQWAIRVACQAAHGIVANSRAAGSNRTGLWPAAGDKIAVIPNGIELSAFVPQQAASVVREQLALPPGAPLVGILGALRPEKDHATFLRAAALVAESVPQARFVLIGDGSERGRLEALANELGIRSRVLFAGDRRGVADMLHALDVFVLSSRTESFPNAVHEAMAAARPVVATRVGGIPELVDDGKTGFLVPPVSPAEMAARVAELLREPERRRAMGQAGRARVEREFTAARMKERLEALYDRMLRQRRPLARVMQIGNYPPPVCGWSMHTLLVERELARRGADSRVMDIGPGRTVPGRGCETVLGGMDYARKLLRYRARGFTFHAHVNGDSWKGYVLALLAVLTGRLTGKPAVLTFHAGPSQIYFPRRNGFWHWAFKLLFNASGEVICNHQPVKDLIVAYGVPEARVHPIPAFSSQYGEEIPVPLPAAVETFLAQHEPRLFSYSLFRPEFTMSALFDAFAELRREFPRAGLLIAGPAETPAEFAGQLERLGLRDAVLIPGNLPHAEFLTAVQRSDVFVRTHLRDGVCTSVLEALKLGVPVVAAEDGIRPPSVVTYAPGDAADLARKLRGVLADLPAARAAVQPPAVENQLERELDVILRVALGENAAATVPQTREARG